MQLWLIDQSLPNNANSGQACARWMFGITRRLQRELRLTKRCRQRCHILVCHSTAFIHTLQCLLCFYLTPRLRQCAVVCGKKSTRHLWMIKLPGTNNDAVFVRTLSRKLFSACAYNHKRYNDAIMGAMAFQITSLTIVHSNIYSGADQENANAPRHYPLCGSPVNSPQKWPVTRKMFPFDDVIMRCSMTVHVSEATIKYGVQIACIYQEQYYSHAMKQNITNPWAYKKMIAG